MPANGNNINFLSLYPLNPTPSPPQPIRTTNRVKRLAIDQGVVTAVIFPLNIVTGQAEFLTRLPPSVLGKRQDTHHPYVFKCLICGRPNLTFPQLYLPGSVLGSRILILNKLTMVDP